MKIKLNVNDILTPLVNATGVVGTKNSIAILSCVVLEVGKNNTLILTASDGSQWVSTKATIEETDIDEGTKFCIEAKDLKQALSNLAGRSVELSFDEASHTMTCTFANGKFTLPYLSADEYPQSTSIEGEGRVEFLLDAPKVARMIAQTDYAMANDPLRMVMNGTYFDFHVDNLSVVASDGHKLALCQDKTVDDGNENSFILMSKSVSILATLIEKEEGMIKIAFNGNNVCINNQNFKLTAKLIEGKFPNYKAVIPQESKISVKVNKDDILGAMKRILPMSSTATEVVKFIFSPNLLTLFCEDVDFSKSASEMMQCDYPNAEDFTIGFKGSAIIQSLQAIEGDEVLIQMTESNRAAIFTSAIPDEKYSHIALVMPMLVE